MITTLTFLTTEMTTKDYEILGSGLGQTSKCDRVKHDTETLNFFISNSPATKQIQYMYRLTLKDNTLSQKL